MDSQQPNTIPTPNPPAPIEQPSATAPAGASTTAAPPIADDGDLIEKEWVEQVKRVLQTNAGNPYEQNRQLAHLRADYMQKRYGKDLKTGD